MASFNPALLVPASNVAELSKPQAGRTMKAVALANIDKQIELLKDPKKEGKRTFRIVGDNAAFSIRVSNKPLVLATVTNGPGKGEVTEMACPARFLEQGFAHYAERIKAGEYDAALLALDEARGARVEKMRSTRASKKETGPAK